MTNVEDALSGLTEGGVRGRVSTETFERADEYERSGAVLTLTRRGSALVADVAGSSPSPYQVRITLDAGGVQAAACTCPYEYGGWCKHVVAVLLACVRHPARVETLPEAEDVLADLTADELRAVLQRLIERDPALLDTVAGLLAVQQQTTTVRAQAAAPVRPTIDTRVFRRQVAGALHSLDRMRPSDAYGYVNGVVGEVRSVLEQAQAFTRAGDAVNALAALEAITDGYVDSWYELDDSDGEMGEFFADLDAAWAEAILTADLSATQKRDLSAKLHEWAGEAGEYGIDEAFDLASQALEEGFDAPAGPARRQWDAHDGETVDYGPRRPDLTELRLNILERRGQTEEFLRLARTAGRHARYALALAGADQAHEAFAYGMSAFREPSEALELAKLLHERGESDLALRMGEHGLTLQGVKGELGPWLRDFAAGLGSSEIALAAAETTFREAPNLSNYTAAQGLAGDQWPAVRARLLEQLRSLRTYDTLGQVEVFLHEDLIDDAIKAADRGYSREAKVRVADAALYQRPDWVIATAHAEADPVISGGKSSHYAEAVQWLSRAKVAYKAAGREAEWQAHLAGLRTQHRRKYALMPLLQQL